MRYRSLRRLTDPASEPLTLAETKSHLRLEHSDDDTLVNTLIQAAREFVEEYLDQTLITTQWEMSFDKFPAEIELPRPPASTASGYTSVSLTYNDDNGNVITLPTSDYRVDNKSIPGVLRPKYAESWPAYRLDHNSITVTWYAGYGENGSDVPRRIRHAMLMLITHLYENRSSVLVGQGFSAMPVPDSMRMLLDSSKFGAYV